MADWIDGYQITTNGPGSESLISPSGIKIAAIVSTADWVVIPLSPELAEEGYAINSNLDKTTHRSIEAACQELVVAHAKSFRVVRFSDVSDAVERIANSIVQVHGDNNQVNVGKGNVAIKVDGKPPSTVLKFLKEDLPKAITSGAILDALKGF